MGRRKRKSPELDAEQIAAIRKNQQLEERLKAELDQLRNSNEFAFSVEDAVTYRKAIDEENKRLGDVAAKKAHRRMKEGVRMVLGKMKKERKEPVDNQDLINDWVNFTVLETSRLVTTGGSQSRLALGGSSSTNPAEQFTVASPIGQSHRDVSISDCNKSILASGASPIGQSHHAVSVCDMNKSILVSGLSHHAGSIVDGSDNSVEELLRVCCQDRVLDFEEVIWTVESKLGEGVYGEVYHIKTGEKDLAVKVIPFAGDATSDSTVMFNGGSLKSPGSMVPEIVITRELSSLRENSEFKTDGFVELHRALVVKGEYPPALVAKWNEFRADRGTENDPPSVYSSPTQMYLLLCLTCAGQELEHFEIRDVPEASSIFTQLAFTLMIAEDALEFEHRDLHVGNILVSRDNVPDEIEYKHDGKRYRIATHGVKVTIIDFTNARMRKAATTIFVDLESEPDLFSGTGDYQFDIYRMMRQHCNGQWRNFHHYNNLMWMHYLATKIFDTDRYPKQKRAFRKPANATRNMLSYTSIRDYIVSDEFAPLFELVAC